MASLRPRQNVTLPDPSAETADSATEQEMQHEELGNEMRLEMKYVINFMVRDGKSKADIYRKLCDVYGDAALGQTRVYALANKAASGSSAAARVPGSGRPATATTQENIIDIELRIRENRFITIRELEMELSISKERINYIISDVIGFKKCQAAWVPKNLTHAQRQVRVNVCQAHLDIIETDGGDYLRNVITCDETWLFYNDPPTRKESRHYRHSSSPLFTVAKRGLTPKKRLMISFFGIDGFLCSAFLPAGTTIDSKAYINIIKTRLIRKIREKRPELISSAGIHRWVLHQDNARPHTSAYTRQWLAAKGITVMEHPPYSPDLAPCDFWLFPKIKSDLRGTEYESEDQLKQAALASLSAIPKEQFPECYESWINRMKRCVEAEGHYL